VLVREIVLEIMGPGVILYSPPAVAHIREGADYLREHFWKPEDVAQHVMACQLTAFATGSPGSFRLRFRDGPPDDRDVLAADFKLRLGFQVRAGTFCVRDLYDLAHWAAECPTEQQASVSDGWYRLTVLSSLPRSGLIGDNQVIEVNMEPTHVMPKLRWNGVPQLCTSARA